MAADRRHRARASALVCHPIAIIHPEAEGRIMVKEERGDVIIIDHQQHVGPLIFEPCADREIGVKDRLPGRILLLVGVKREADGRRMRTGDRADNGGHV